MKNRSPFTKIAMASRELEDAGHTDLSVVADLIISLREGNPHLRRSLVDINKVALLNVGDTVVFSKEYRNLGVKLGSIGTVSEFNSFKKTYCILLKGKSIDFPMAEVQNGVIRASRSVEE